VAFNAIERMIGDFGIANKLKLSRLAVQPHAEKVAVIGAGRLACPAAYQLVRRGYPVTVFEALSEPEACCAMASQDSACHVKSSTRRSAANSRSRVELKCKLRGRKRKSPWSNSARNLRRYSPVLVAHKGIKLDVPGEDAPNVLSGIGFLKSVHGGEQVDVGSKVVVVGAGGTACDVARLSRRLEAEVTMVGLEMTATKSEAEGAAGRRCAHRLSRRSPGNCSEEWTRIGSALVSASKPGRRVRMAAHTPVPIAGSEFDWTQAA